MRYFVLACLLVAGCAHRTPEQKAAALKAKYGDDCKALGIKPGIPAFGNCLLQERADRMNRYQTWKAITQ